MKIEELECPTELVRQSEQCKDVKLYLLIQVCYGFHCTGNLLGMTTDAWL